MMMPKNSPKQPVSQPNHICTPNPSMAAPYDDLKNNPKAQSKQKMKKKKKKQNYRWQHQRQQLHNFLLKRVFFFPSSYFSCKS
jgi:hypothetical protein